MNIDDPLTMQGKLDTLMRLCSALISSHERRYELLAAVEKSALTEALPKPYKLGIEEVAMHIRLGIKASEQADLIQQASGASH